MEESAETIAVAAAASTRLRRRNSIATTSVPVTVTPTKRSLQIATSLPPLNCASSTPKIDLELVSFNSSTSSLSFSSYTSLRDLLPPSSVNSPTAASYATGSAISAPGSGISIRNRLVKQAAWAYLRPMSSSPSSSSPRHFLRRLWLRLSSRNPIAACLRCINSRFMPALIRIFDRILLIFGVPVSR